jgi:hypothetical protein
VCTGEDTAKPAISLQGCDSALARWTNFSQRSGEIYPSEDAMRQAESFFASQLQK